MIDELHDITPISGVAQVLYPGEIAEINYAHFKKEGIPVIRAIYDYLISEDVHYNKFYHGKSFAGK